MPQSQQTNNRGGVERPRPFWVKRLNSHFFNVMSKQIIVTAIIHLEKRGRSASGRYGKFLRPDKCPHPQATDLHLWEGRELSIAEFNEMFPIAMRSVVGTDRVFGQIIVREVDVEGDALETEAMDKLKKEHEAAIEELNAEHGEALKFVQAEKAEAVSLSQDVVNAFTATHNANLAEAKARIEELEAIILGYTSQPNPAAEKPAAETISEEGSQVEAPLVEAAPPVAGEQPEASVTAIPDAKAEELKAKAAPKAKSAPKK